jgi:hypothetical protein
MLVPGHHLSTASVIELDAFLEARLLFGTNESVQSRCGSYLLFNELNLISDESGH